MLVFSPKVHSGSNYSNQNTNVVAQPFFGSMLVDLVVVVVFFFLGLQFVVGVLEPRHDRCQMDFPRCKACEKTLAQILEALSQSAKPINTTIMYYGFHAEKQIIRHMNTYKYMVTNIQMLEGASPTHYCKCKIHRKPLTQTPDGFINHAKLIQASERNQGILTQVFEIFVVNAVNEDFQRYCLRFRWRIRQLTQTCVKMLQNASKTKLS